ncbi:MAG TPA: choice-of-anchor tandem repeat GloVer-containing protein [Lacipirellulaceae bacterium]
MVAGGTGTGQTASSAQYTLTSLASFNVTNGSRPETLVGDASGNLYGVTEYGGNVSNDQEGYGSVFEVTAGTHTLHTLATFNNTVSGSTPNGSLIVDAAGNFCGTADQGGTYGLGTVFELAAGTNSLDALATFDSSNGEGPIDLTSDANGNLYGMTYRGGTYHAGTVFLLTAGTHIFSTLVSFNGTNGAGSLGDTFGSLISDANGNIYGTTTDGGTNNKGTLFEIVAGSHSFSTLVTFNGMNGSHPAGLVLDANGNVYGTTFRGGASDAGTVFELSADTHTLTTLAAFNGANGELPNPGLIVDASGNLYGTTYEGGKCDNCGTVFKVAAGARAVTTLAAFDGSNGLLPAGGLTVDAYGNLYGTTEGGTYDKGTVFKLSPGTGTLITLVSFDGTNGDGPDTALIVDANGNVYGSTYGGGVYGWGTVFELSPAPGVLGDYNGDGVVDAADYSVWRDTLGSTTELRANGNNTGTSMGVVDQADYDFWKAHFGMEGGSGSLSAVPEPASIMLFIGALPILGCRR